MGRRWRRAERRRSARGSRAAGVEQPPAPVQGFGEASQRAELDEVGFLRLGPLIGPSECRRLYDVFDEAMAMLGREPGSTWWPSITIPDAAVRAFIDREMSAVVRPSLQRWFDPGVLEPVRFDYSVKPPGPEGVLGPHQDYSVVDERRWASLYFWVPLTDMDATNGTLHVLPGSHRYTNRVRSLTVPSRFDPVIDRIEERSVRLDCAAGELVVMVSGLVHWSPPNRGERLRLAGHGILKPRLAPTVFFHADDATPEGLVEMYEVDIDRYIEMLLGRPPRELAPLSGYCPRPPGMMDPERFEAGHRACA